MRTAKLDEIIKRLGARRQTDPESISFQRILLKYMALGQPVTAEQIADETGHPLNTIQDAFRQLRAQGCEFDGDSNLVGMILTQNPTPHRFRVDGRDLYAWCALDTLFLPALLGQTAEVESICPISRRNITLTVTPEKIEACSLPEVTLSIMTAECCAPGPQGDFCGQIFFFASEDAAAAWIGGRSGMEILSVNDAFTLARAVYVDAVISD
jgi:alkylmercury lyase